MSSSSIIKTIENELKNLLGVNEDKITWDNIDSQIGIEFGVPSMNNKNMVYFFLYQIVDNIYLKNEEPERIDISYHRPSPLVLDLFYMVTAYGQNRYEILGRIMQIFHDDPILILKNNNNDTEEEVRILFNPISLDNQTKIWSTFKDVPFQLTIGYMLTPVRIDSTEHIEVSPVTAKRMEYSQFELKKEERA